DDRVSDEVPKGKDFVDTPRLTARRGHLGKNFLSFDIIIPNNHGDAVEGFDLRSNEFVENLLFPRVSLPLALRRRHR
ncbi:hypothetical protein ACQUFE_18500, partial [Enterococcus casseliflavus]|uniref:hypothetical protein n=1 Tax=Enterococcus casseliflavus TaxID=37734 RepID=UPI003D0ED41A